LLSAGWRHTPLEDDLVGTRYRWQTSELEFTFVEDRDGTSSRSLGTKYVGQQSSRRGRERSLSGVRARVIPLKLLRDGKRKARDTPAEAARDVAGLAALADV
jgi:hypothetical protein